MKKFDGISINGTMFAAMNNTQLAYNLGELTAEELKQVPQQYIVRWEKWQELQRQNTAYWSNPLHS